MKFFFHDSPGWKDVTKKIEMTAFMIMKTKFFTAIIAVMAVAGMIWFLSADEESPGKNRQEGRTQVPAVETAAVFRGDIARTISLTGEIIPQESVKIAAVKEGLINYFPRREGDEVEAGEKLVEIDRQIYRAELKKAEARLNSAQAKLAHLKSGSRPEELDQQRSEVRKWRASLEQARADYERQKELRLREFTSKQAIDQARERMEVTEAELKRAEEKLRMMEAGPAETEIAVQEAAVQEASSDLVLAEAHLDECVINAPFGGIISQAHVRRGDLAVPRSSLIEMYDPDSLAVQFAVPESQSAAVAEGAQVSIVLDAFPGKQLRGKVKRVYPELDRKLRTRIAEAEIIEDIKTSPGMFARVKLDIEKAEEAVLVPENAVIEKNGVESVFVFEDGRVHTREVSVGITDGRTAQILKGLEEGEKVVTTPPRNLSNGVEVRTDALHDAGDGGLGRGR